MTPPVENLQTERPAPLNRRQCIACRGYFPRAGMLKLCHERVSGGFSIDNEPPRQGRSAYVCRQSACLAEAIKGKKFQRTLKRAIPDDIVNRLNEKLKGLSG